MPSGSEIAAAAARAAKKDRPLTKLGALLTAISIVSALKKGKSMNIIKAKSAWVSKINWTQAVAMLAMALSFFGFDLDAKTQADVLAAIIAMQGIVTWVLRTFFNNSVSPEMAGKTVTVQKA